MNKGFTLIEIIVVMAIMSGIVFVISVFTLDISEFQIFVGESLEVEQEVHQAFGVMIPEIRSVGPSGNGGYPISVASSSSFSFYSDINNDGLFDQVRYFLDGVILKKGVIKPTGGAPYVYNPSTEEVSDKVNSVTSGNIFSYFDKNYDGVNGSPLSYPIDVSAIRVVKINLVVDENPNVEPGSQIFTTTVEIRNFKGL